MSDKTPFTGALVTAILLAVILFLCIAVLSVAIAVLLKGRSRAKLKVSSQSSRLPQVDLDTTENIAYGVSLSAHASSS